MVHRSRAIQHQLAHHLKLCQVLQVLKLEALVASLVVA